MINKMNDTNYIFRCYHKIDEILKGYEKQDRPSLEHIQRLRTWLGQWVDHVSRVEHVKKRYEWMNRAWIDQIEFILKNQRRRRAQFLDTYYTILEDIADRLDKLDGGIDNQLKTEVSSKCNKVVFSFKEI